MKIPDGWELKEEKLHRKFTFKTFGEAMSFMQDCIPVIDKMNHHPNWSNVYASVEVNLFTHTTGDVTDKDILLAEKMNEIYSSI